MLIRSVLTYLSQKGQNTQWPVVRNEDCFRRPVRRRDENEKVRIQTLLFGILYRFLKFLAIGPNTVYVLRLRSRSIFRGPISLFLNSDISYILLASLALL